jgi:hypothetical protein
VDFNFATTVTVVEVQERGAYTSEGASTQVTGRVPEKIMYLSFLNLAGIMSYLQN